MEKVSVIIPTYNRAEYLKFTLDSVINQTYSNIEVIVVDDGTPNAMTKELCELYTEVVYIKIPNSGGPATPRNVGYKQATGDYIAFLDDDDIWLPEKIELQVNLLRAHPDFGIVHAYCEVIDANGKPTGEFIGRPGHVDVKHGDVRLKMTGNWTLMMPTPLIRRSVIEDVGLFNTKIPPALEDVEFWTRCSFFTKFYYLDRVLAYYRKHINNISGHERKYVDLPIHLNGVIDAALRLRKISNEEFRQLQGNLCLSQAKYVTTDFKKTLLNLFKLNPFWIINFRIIKTLISRLTK